MSNHPILLELDTLTCQNFFIFGSFVGIIEILVPKISDIAIWKFGQNTLLGPKSAILNLRFL